MQSILGATEEQTIRLWLEKYPTEEEQKDPDIPLSERLLVRGSLLYACRAYHAPSVSEDELQRAADELDKIPWRKKLAETIRQFLAGTYPKVWNLTFFNLALKLERVDLARTAILECPQDDPRYLWNFICGLAITRKDGQPVDISPLAPLVPMALSLLPMDEDTKDYILNDKGLFPHLLNCRKLTEGYHELYNRVKLDPIFRLLKQRHISRHPVSLEEAAYLANYQDSPGIAELVDIVIFYWAIFAQEPQIKWLAEILPITNPRRKDICWALNKRRLLDKAAGDYAAAIRILGITDAMYGDDDYSYLFCMLEAHRGDDEPFGEEAKRHFGMIAKEDRRIVLVILGFAVHSSVKAKRPLALLWLETRLV